MFSLTNRLANSALQRNNYFPLKNGIEFVVQCNRSASVKLTPHDVSFEELFFKKNIVCWRQFT